MKRLPGFLLALAMLFVLCSCEQKPPENIQNGEAATPPAQDESIRLAQLNVEFVAGDRDTGALLQLKKELPPLLISALAEQGVAVDSVSITFGASAEATAQALSKGSVQLGFLPSSVYCAYADGLHAVADRENAGNALIGLYLPYGEQNKALLEKLTPVPWGEAFTTEDLIRANWSIPANDEVAERYLALLLQEKYALSLQELENLSYYSDFAGRDEALKTAHFMVIYGFDAVENNFCATLENLPLEGEVAAVSAADEIVSSSAFRAALQQALAALCLNEDAQEVLALYGGGEFVNYHPMDDSAYASQRYVLGYTET